jgi:hypothetical protein
VLPNGQVLVADGANVGLGHWLSLDGIHFSVHNHQPLVLETGWGNWGAADSSDAHQKSCYLAYCNAWGDLKNAKCGGHTCTSDAQADSCKSDWETNGHREASRSAGPDPEACISDENLQYGSASYTLAGDVCELEGVVERDSTSAVITKLPSSCRPIKRMIFDMNINGKTARVDVTSDGQVLWRSGGTNQDSQEGGLSLGGIMFATSATRSPLTLSNGWQAQNPTHYPPQYTKTETLCLLEGLITNSGINDKYFGSVPSDCRPAGRMVFNLLSHPGQSVRVDIHSNGWMSYEGGTASVSWLSLSGIRIPRKIATQQCGQNEHVQSKACTACSPGTTRAAGDKDDGADTTCSPVICGANQHVLNHKCTACPTDTTNTAGNDASGKNTVCTRKAMPATDGRLEAPMQIVDDYIVVPNGAGNDQGVASFTIETTASTTVQLEAEVMTPSGTDNSWILSFNDGPDDSHTDGHTWHVTHEMTWTWKTINKAWTLSEGVHIFHVKGREDGSKLRALRIKSGAAEFQRGDPASCKYDHGDRSFGGSLELEAGDYFGIYISTGQGFQKCRTGEIIQLLSDPCAEMPLAPYKYYNAIGITLPTMIINLFGLELDVADQIGSDGVGDNSKRNSLSNSKRSAALSKAGEVGGSATGDGFCLAYPASVPMTDFAFGAAGLLVAECCLGATIIECPCVTDGTPTITFEFLGAAFSLARDLTFETTAGVWNGNQDFETAAAEPLNPTGVLYASAAIAFSAFEFSLAGIDVGVEIELVGKIMLDLKTPSGDGVVQALRALANPSTFKNLDSADLPAFQITVDGALGFACELGPGFAFSSDLGGATVTFGTNMGSDSAYAGFTNGLYATAYTENCLTDRFPPLKVLTQMKCRGKSIFADLCISSVTAFYANNFGMGYNTTFGINIGSVGVKFGLGFEVKKANGLDVNVKMDMRGALYARVGDFQFSVGIHMGFAMKLGQVPTGFFAPTLSCGGSCLAILNPVKDFLSDKIWKEVVDAFTEEQEEQAEEDLQDSMRMDLKDSMEADMQWKRRRRWSVKKTFKKVAKGVRRAVKVVRNVANTVATTVRNAAVALTEAFKNLWGNIKPSLNFETPTISGDICGFTLRVKLGLGIGGINRDIVIKIKFDPADMGRKIIDAVMSAFRKIKNAFKNIFPIG